MPTSSTKATKAYHHGDLRDALIGAAFTTLEEGIDPAALSLREVARRAGVSAMAPYRHFADRDALLAAVAEIGFGRLGKALQDAEKALQNAEKVRSATDALVGQGVAYVAFACANPTLFRLMFGAALAERHGTLAVASREAYAVMADRVATLTDARTANDWAMRCWATAHGLAALAINGQLSHNCEPPAVLAERILQLGSFPGLPE